ncbi:MAG: hypothetical protein LBI53_06955, partial [Candidatus Peribacteria bacterium]|nr:hypothetical protein [Candidatus Peribacteria bacterium]
ITASLCLEKDTFSIPLAFSHHRPYRNYMFFPYVPNSRENLGLLVCQKYHNLEEIFLNVRSKIFLMQ